MKLRFRQKVFLTFLVNSLLIVICMLLIAGYYGHRNFENYIGKVETEKLTELAEALSQEFKERGAWDSVLDNWDHWLRLAAIGPPARSGPGGPGGPAGNPPLPPLPIGAPPPPGNTPGQQGPPPPDGRPPGRGDLLASHLTLFDDRRQPLNGDDTTSSSEYQLRPIAVDGRTVGWLGLKKHDRPLHPLDVEFLSHQLRTFYSIGGVALILAVFVTIVLSRHLLAPVRELAKGTRALTSRRFDTRVKVRSGDEFGQLADDFNTMARELERDEQMRRQWIADISHELRTPLAILRGEIEAMQDGVREMSRKALDSLHFEVLHVNRIVHDLHDLSLIESRAFDFEQTPLNPLDVLDETLRSFHTLFEQRGLRIEVKGAETDRTTIAADADRLKQLFSNLLNNVLHYTSTPGVLEISHEITPGRLVLHFDDSGPGVPAESLERLFDRLYRVDKARSRALGGSGLGLAICKSIVECFGGRIEASNAPTGGLRITITFPVVSV